MSRFQMPVRIYMHHGVSTVRHDASLDAVWDHLEQHRVSSVPVVGKSGRPMGVLSRSDLLRESKVRHQSEGAQPALEFPAVTAGDLTLGVVVATWPDASVAQAAETMLEQHIHRVYVEKDDRLVGVLSARDVMQSIVDKRIDSPVSAWMNTRVRSVPLGAPLSQALEILATGAMSTVLVSDGNWPTGVLTQEEALISRHRDPHTPVEEVMGHALTVLPRHTPMWRAAAQALTMHVQLLVVLGDRRMDGVLGTLDLVRVAADA